MLTGYSRVAVSAVVVSAVLGAAGCAGASSFPSTRVGAPIVPAQRANEPNTDACSTKACIYVTDRYVNAVTVYAKGAHGNIAPIRHITGAMTGLSQPIGIALDASKETYVANFGTNAVTVFKAGANGNVAPKRTISGSNTKLSGPAGVSLDSTGQSYVATPPISFIVGNLTTLSEPLSAVPHASQTIFVANYGNNSVLVFAPGTNGNVPPIRTISGSNTGLGGPGGLALHAGNIYVTNYGNNSVTEFAAGANGNVAPIRTIAGAKTLLTVPDEITFDGLGNIYVTNRDGNSVTVYSKTANGNVAPIRKIVGSNTLLQAPAGMALH